MSSVKNGVRVLLGLLAIAVLVAGLLPGVTIVQFPASLFLRCLLIGLALHLALVIWDRLQRRSESKRADRASRQRLDQG